MTNIRKHSGFNIGGISPVRIAFIEDITSLTVDEETLEATLVMSVSPGWTKIYATDGTIQVTCKEEDTAAGMRYDYEIRMLIPKDRSYVEALLYSLNNRKMIVMVHDKNGTARIYGTLDNPMRKLSKGLRPSSVEGYNGYELIFFGSFSLPAAYTTEAYPYDEDYEDAGSSVE